LVNLDRRQHQHGALCLGQSGDVTLAILSAFNAACCAAVLLLAAYRRTTARLHRSVA
jgi:hypothetical protein